MSYKDFINYITDKNNYQSFMNNEFKKYMIDNGYYINYQIKDNFEYRVDLIAQTYLSNSNLDFL